MTKALRSQSIWYSCVVGSTSTTSLRALKLPIRVTFAITRSWLSNANPCPAMCKSSLISGWSLIRVPVSAMPVIWASASTPLCSRAAVLAADFAPQLANASAINTSAAVISKPT